MAAIAFDTLKAARRLEEAGVPEAQEEAHAELMAEAFVFNMDALVTRDYLDQCLDARFAAHEARFAAHEARLEARQRCRPSWRRKQAKPSSGPVRASSRPIISTAWPHLTNHIL